MSNSDSVVEQGLTSAKLDVMKELRHDFPLVDYALDNGGFIAGGFARYIARMTDDVSYQNLRSYLRPGSDIDLFFRNDTALKDCLIKLVSEPKFTDGHIWSVRPSHMKTAYDIMMSDLLQSNATIRANVKIQLISCVFGSPEQVMSTFDFVNCKFAIANDKLLFSERAVKLDDANQLGIQHMKLPTFAWRTKKYIFKHGYSSFAHGDAAPAIDFMLMNPEQCATLALFLIQKKDFLTPDESLLLMSIFGEKGPEHYHFLRDERVRSSYL